MKIYLGCFALVLFLALLVNFKHEQYANQAATYSRDKCFFVFANCAPDGKSYTETPNSNAEIWWERGYIFFGWPNGTTIWTLVITFAVISDQTNHTRRAANSGLKAARATERQLEHLIATERPWLLITWEGSIAEGFHFTATNVGRSPAKIVWMNDFIDSSLVPTEQRMITLPTNGISREFEFIHTRWLKPNGRVFIGTFDRFTAHPGFNSEMGGYQGGLQRLFIYSVVKYRTTVDDVVHESNFCYRLGSGRLIMDGPPEYNQYT